MYELRVLQKARSDMKKSAAWYDKQQPGVGDRFLLAVVAEFNLIVVNPLHYEEKFSKTFRFAPVERFPFLIVFRIKGQQIIVNSVFHTSRNPKRFV